MGVTREGDADTAIPRDLGVYDSVLPHLRSEVDARVPVFRGQVVPFYGVVGLVDDDALQIVCGDVVDDRHVVREFTEVYPIAPVGPGLSVRPLFRAVTFLTSTPSPTLLQPTPWTQPVTTRF